MVVTLGIGVAACGFMNTERRPAWRNKAESLCIKQKLVPETAFMSRGAAIRKGSCGMNAPYKVMAFAGGSVQMKTRQTLACPIISVIEDWIANVVQPAAQIYFGSPVVEMHTGSYSCRGRNNKKGARLSEHSFGNALDVMSFTFENGETVTVKKGWSGSEAEYNFLREVFVGSCAYFTTVLGPGSDRYHSDHFHLDLARHNKDWTNRYCRPILKYTPQLQYDTSKRSAFPVKIRD